MTTSSPEAAAPSAWSPPHLGETETVTVSSIRATLDDARQKGYDEGFEKGHADGLAKAQPITADLQQLWEAMAQPFARQEEALFKEQCLLVSRVAMAVLERELQTEPASIETALKKALELLKNSAQTIEIQVNSSDVRRLEEVAPELLQNQPWRVEVDDDVMPGGCRVQAGDSIVDATLEGRLTAAIKEAVGLEVVAPAPLATSASAEPASPSESSEPPEPSEEGL
jgi:flagellar assembly protein FliH